MPEEASLEGIEGAGKTEGRPGARQAPAAPAQKGLRERAAATSVGGITPAFPAQGKINSRVQLYEAV
jgi:hypothetical protein